MDQDTILPFVYFECGTMAMSLLQVATGGTNRRNGTYCCDDVVGQEGLVKNWAESCEGCTWRH